jgi:2-oxoglutarate/2-oxoacid ferredoxin oxidoreductase subunit beta
LTKGQFSPTSIEGQITKTTPGGVVDHPLNPLMLAVGADATFVARSVDSNVKHLAYTLKRAAAHKGTSFVEVYQNCNVFNDGAFAYAQDKSTRDDATIELEHGKPMIFGKNRDKGIRLNGLNPEIVDLNKSGVKEDDLWFHDEQADSIHAFLLSRLRHPRFPEPIGVLRAVQSETFDEAMRKQVSEAIAKKGKADLQKLLNSGETWKVA